MKRSIISIMVLFVVLQGILAQGKVIKSSRSKKEPPKILWVSDPVRPDEAIMLQGGNFGSDAAVEIARLEDGRSEAPAQKELAGEIQWTKVTALQKTDNCVKMVLPGDWKMGVFAIRITAGGGVSLPVLVNAPGIWWIQGDLGETASIGGWIRVLGKSLNFGGTSIAWLQPENGQAVRLESTQSGCYNLRFEIPAAMKQGKYNVWVHNGLGGEAAWMKADAIEIKQP